MLPTSFSLWLYCGEPACTPSCISFALLLVDAPHLVLSAVVLRRACLHSSWSSHSLHSSLTLPSVDGSSLVLSVVILREPARAPPHTPLSSLRSPPCSLEHPRVTHVHVRLIYILFACTNLCLLLASRHSPSTCHFAIDSPHTSHALIVIVACPCDRRAHPMHSSVRMVPAAKIWRKARMAHHGGRRTNTMGSSGMSKSEADVLLALTMQQR